VCVCVCVLFFSSLDFWPVLECLISECLPFYNELIYPVLDAVPFLADVFACFLFSIYMTLVYC
jgi:hypothetical protein